MFLVCLADGGQWEVVLAPEMSASRLAYRATVAFATTALSVASDAVPDMDVLPWSFAWEVDIVAPTIAVHRVFASAAAASKVGLMPAGSVDFVFAARQVLPQVS